MKKPSILSASHPTSNSRERTASAVPNRSQTSGVLTPGAGGEGYRSIHERVFIVLAFLFFVLAIPVFSQSQLPDAHVSGTLTDPSGAGIGGAQVTAQPEGAARAQLWSASSTADGAYHLSLPPGRYVVHFSRDPFAPREFTWDLSPGESRTVDFRMELATLSASVLVTGQAGPINTQQSAAPSSILTTQEINQRQVITLPNLIGTEPGISSGQTGPIGGLTSVFLDGGNSTYTKVFIDGTPVNEPGGYLNYVNLALDNVDKVETVHGAESTLYGSDAMSGVIQLFSHRGTTRIPAFQLFSEGGNLSSGRGGGQVSGLLGHFDYSGAASYTQTDGQGLNDAFINRTFAGNFGYGFSDTNQLRLTVRSNSSWSGIPGATLLEPATLGQYDDLQNLTANLSWTFNSGQRWQHRLAGSESRILDTNFIPGYGSLVDQYNRADFNEQSTYSFVKGLIALGYQYEVENGYPSLISGFHARRNNQAGFVDGRWFPISRVTVSAGFRVESNTTFGIRTVPRAGIALAVRYGKGFWGDTRVRFAYGEGIKEPSLGQSFGADPCFPGNPNLKPEQSQTYNTTLDQYLASDRLRLSVTYFNNRFEDMISFANCIPGGLCEALPPSTCPYGNGTYFNTDLARARGLNFTSELRLRKWLSLDGYYTYDSTRVIKSENPYADPALVPGSPLLRRPLNSGSVILNILYAKINWNLIGYFSGPRTDSNFVNPTQIINPGYARFDMAASYNMTHSLAITARVFNLFNKQYQTAIGYPALGQTYAFGGRYIFAGHN